MEIPAADRIALRIERAPETAVTKQEKLLLTISAPCFGFRSASGAESHARSSTVGNSIRSGESL